MDYSLAHEQGLGGHLGAPKQAVERGKNVEQEILHCGYLFYIMESLESISKYPHIPCHKSEL